MPATRRLGLALGLFFLVVFGGALGYVVLEGAAWLDALYMALISVTTVGFNEVIPLDAAGRVLTMAVIVLGVGSLTFATVSGIEFLFEGHLQRLVERRRMDREIGRLEGHTIVCGFGRVGRQAADQLAAEARPVAVVDVDPERIQLAARRGLPYVEGDASREEILTQAGVARARSIVACTADDAENILIALTAKGLEQDLFVVVRMKDEENEGKARRAGADRVIAPAAIGGRRIAALVTRPYVVDFLDIVTHGTDVDVVLEEIAIDAASPLVNVSLRDAHLRERYHANVLAVRGAAGDLTTHPAPDHVITAGDVLVVIGGRDDLDRMQADARS